MGGTGVARLPISNDFTPPGALPLVKLEINGYSVELILDTCGNMLYIDEAVAEKVGVRTSRSGKPGTRTQEAYTSTSRSASPTP